MGVTAQHQ